MSQRVECIRYSTDVPFIIQNIGHYRIDWKKICSCSRKQKQNLVPFIDKLINFERSIMAGELTLSNLMNQFEDSFERYAISLLRDGWKYEMISDLLYNFVSSSELPAEIYLEYVIFIRFILEEKKGYHDCTTLYPLLMSYLGVEFIKPSFLPQWLIDEVKKYGGE